MHSHKTPDISHLESSVVPFTLTSHQVETPVPPDRPVNVLVLTSARDIIGDDNCGRIVPTRSHGNQYMMGATEALVRNTNDGALRGLVNVVGVVYDDLPRDAERKQFPLHGDVEDQWIYPLSMRNEPLGVTMRELTRNVPSSYRLSARSQETERASEKARFEDEIAAVVDATRADAIVSDHLMVILAKLISSDGHGMYGRALNIHPALTSRWRARRLRGESPTQDAIDRAQGFRRDHRTGERTATEPYFRTGATFHLIDEGIDTGHALADTEPTIVHPDDEPQWLRHRNYPAKYAALVYGLRHYVRDILPVVRAVKPHVRVGGSPTEQNYLLTEPSRH